MQTVKACLFGGTLVAAGLAATEARAQSFVNSGGVAAAAYAYDYASYAYEGVTTAGFDFSAARFESFASASGGSGSWGWDSAAGTWGVAVQQGNDLAVEHVSNLVSIFTVDADYTLTIAWDFSNADTATPFSNIFSWQLLASDDSIFQLDELVDGFAADQDLGTPSGQSGLVGSVTLQLDSSKVYQLGLDLFARSGGFAQSGTITASLGPVPSPAALPLLAGGLLAAGGRRRR